MKKIFFSSAEEAYELGDVLHTYDRQLPWELKNHKKWGSYITVKDDLLPNGLIEKIGVCLAHIYSSSYLFKAIEEIIQSVYYYTNEAEINRILQISDDMLKREDDAIPQGVSAGQLEDELQRIFIRQLRKTKVFYFDSIIKFCLDPVRKKLIELVGIAIDDFKREEEQQNYLQTLRQYIDQRESTYYTIHLLQNKPFKFYTQGGEQINKELCKKLAKQIPLRLFSLEQHDLTLGPLIAISPKSIYIYGEFLSEPMTLTIMNIFQERVKFKPLKDFPFNMG